MEPESSLPCSQVPATCPCPEPARSGPYTHISLPENPFYTIPSSTPGSTKWSLSPMFPHQNPINTSPLLSSICSTCPTHLVFLDLITRKTQSEQYRSLSSSSRTFLHSPLTSSLLRRNILLNTLFSKSISLCFSLNVNDQVSHPTKQQALLQFCIS